MLKYEGIIDYVKQRIADQHFSYNKKLPSVRELSLLFNCSVGTVLKAYDELEKQKIIYSQPKSGYFILDNLRSKQNEDNKILDFSSAVPDAESFPYDNFQTCLNKAIEIYKDRLFHYSDSPGLPALITLLSKHFRQHQIFTKPENIVITSSSQQALNIFSLMPLPNNRSRVLVEQPTYHGMVKTLNFHNIPSIGIHRDFDGINMEELERVFKYENIKFFYTMSRFHNPLATSYTQQEKLSIIRLAEKYQVYIIEDDIAADMEADQKNASLFSYAQSPYLIYLKSYSKILMPGLRVAALILPKPLLPTFLEYKKWIDSSSPVISQGALELYIRNGLFDSNKKKIIKLYASRLDCLKSELLRDQESKFIISIPKAGYFACLHAPASIPFSKIIPVLKKKNISIHDTSGCFLPGYNEHKYMRLCISKVSNEQIQTGIPSILKAIKDYQA